MRQFRGKALFLDRSDINTDEIIPAKYLTEISKEALGPHLLEDLELPGFDPKENLEGISVIVSRNNFGCGSSREHAPWALEMNGIYLIIAGGFARIFRQNMFNCGMMAIELPHDVLDHVFVTYAESPVTITAELDAKQLIFQREDGTTESVPFSMSQFDEELVRAGGWIEYADTKYA